MQSIAIPLPIGRHNLTLNFVSPPGDVSTRSFVTVFSVDIVGSSIGAAEAVQCQPGYVSSTSGASSCAPCLAGTAAPEAGMSTCSPCPVGSFSSEQGSASCAPCGAGSYTNGQGSSKCLTGCTFDMQNGTHFDLRQLTERMLYDLRNSREIVLNPCGNTSRLGCESYVCSRSPDATDVVVMGRNPEFTPPIDSQQWLLSYSEGRLCPSTGKRSLVTIRFRCDLSSPNNLGEPRVVEADDCTVYLEWVTPAACAACTAADFSAVYGKCQAGVQKVTFVAPASCYNSGFDQPATEELSCSTRFLISTANRCLTLAHRRCRVSVDCRCRRFGGFCWPCCCPCCCLDEESQIVCGIQFVEGCSHGSARRSVRVINPTRR
jgi:hypothetical protein